MWVSIQKRMGWAIHLWSTWSQLGLLGLKDLSQDGVFTHGSGTLGLSPLLLLLLYLIFPLSFSFSLPLSLCSGILSSRVSPTGCGLTFSWCGGLLENHTFYKGVGFQKVRCERNQASEGLLLKQPQVTSVQFCWWKQSQGLCAFKDCRYRRLFFIKDDQD